MISNKKVPYFYKDKPIFGMDIGHSSLKVMQSSFGIPNNKSKRPRIIGYGSTSFDKSAIKDGVIEKPEIIAQAANDLFKNKLVGDITTNRAVIAVPAYRIYTRYMVLPKLKASEMDEAVRLEVEQYLSSPLEELYVDWEITTSSKTQNEVFFVALPRNIIDSYLDLVDILGLETILIEPTLSASSRLFSFDQNNNIPSLIVDFGSQSSDMSIFVNRVMATGTVNSGGDTFTEKIKQALDVTEAEAKIIKDKYGLGLSKKQHEINKAVEPILNDIVRELKRVIRYYEEQFDSDSKQSIKQIVTMGGGANMPGLNDYLTSSMRLAVRHSDPWQYFDFNKLEIPSTEDKPMYATVAGLSIINPKKVFSNA
jgi:type IV pilus assembly protein PilM